LEDIILDDDEFKDENVELNESGNCFDIEEDESCIQESGETKVPQSIAMIINAHPI
jgi:hypothetical protein